MPSASKQFEEHIASGAFVRPFVRPGVGVGGRGLLGRAASCMKHYTGFAAGIGILFMPPASKKL